MAQRTHGLNNNSSSSVYNRLYTQAHTKSKHSHYLIWIIIFIHIQRAHASWIVFFFILLFASWVCLCVCKEYFVFSSVSSSLLFIFLSMLGFFPFFYIFFFYFRVLFSAYTRIVVEIQRLTVMSASVLFRSLSFAYVFTLHTHCAKRHFVRSTANECFDTVLHANACSQAIPNYFSPFFT